MNFDNSSSESQNVFALMTCLKKRNINNKNCPQLKQLQFDRYDKLSPLISNLEVEKLHHNSTSLIMEDFYVDFWEIFL